MRLVVKVLFVLLFVAVVPVTVSGISGVLLARRAIAEAAGDTLETEARHLAELAETAILGSLDDLKQASLLGLDRLQPAERPGALWLIYRADAQRTAVVLLDGATGESVTDPVFQETVGADPGLADHDPLPAAALTRFAEHIPLAEAMSAGKAVSVPYADNVRGAPFIALAVRVPGPLDAAGKETPWVVAVELSLRRLNTRFEEAKDERLSAFLVDLDGKVVCHTESLQALNRTDVANNTGVQALFDARARASGVVNLDADDDATLVSYARLTRLAGPQGRTWGVVVERARAEALAAVDDLARRVAFWVGAALVLALLAGVVLAQGVVRPVEVLTRVVQSFAKKSSVVGGGGTGLQEAKVRAPALGNDEIGKLAKAFNGMADEIDEYGKQLRTFNDELQHKVEERTRDLKEAQNQLIQSQKMAAVGELGAGVAHEINNPLAAVLGSAQLALLRSDRADTRVRPHLEDIEKEALRIKDIVESLLQLSQDQSQQAMGTVDVNAVVDGALALVARPIISQRIAVKKDLGAELPRIRGRSGDLQQAVLQLLLNAKDAMPEGGTLTLRTDTVDGKLVRLVVEDSGAGIPPQNLERIYEPFFTTRASKGHKGMGLAVVHRIVEEHGGRISVEGNEKGRGAVFKLSFTASRDALHLV
ncbi:MAG: ATP-binding protein [Deltaproteobacteria bacterium]|nr:ATP-binding protein [Deltaproteobacteria bacterium]